MAYFSNKDKRVIRWLAFTLVAGPVLVAIVVAGLLGFGLGILLGG